jgi:hypothetical protein
MGLLSQRVERSEIKPGDHIYTWRAGYAYSHHGTYAPVLLHRRPCVPNSASSSSRLPGAYERCPMVLRGVL